MTTPNLSNKPEMILAAANVSIIEAAAGQPTSPPRFTMTAYTGGTMRLPGYEYPVVVDLAGLDIPSQVRPIRYNHTATAGVGHSDKIAVENGELIAAGQISRNTPEAREVIAAAKNGFPWQASMGASPIALEFIHEDQTAVVNGQQVAGPAYLVRKSRLNEISFVDLGADENTSATIQAKHSEGVARMPEKTGETTPSTTPENAPTIQAGNTGTPQPTIDNEPTVNLADIRAQHAAEFERIGKVQTAAKDFPEITAQAIREGWTVEKTELEVLRKRRPEGPAIHAHSAPAMTNDVLECAALMSGQFKKIEAAGFTDETLEAAQKLTRHGFGLGDILAAAAVANGYSGSFRDKAALLHAAFDIRAGFSTVNIGGILSNTANKFLMAGYSFVEDSWRKIVRIRPVSDFKTITSYRLVNGSTYQKVAAGGELKHGTLSEHSFTNKADTFGLLLSISRQDIYNDDMSALTSQPQDLGRIGALTLNDVVWSMFMDNADFFKAANKNFSAGVGTALGIDGLSQAEQAFDDKVGADGKPLGLTAAILLTPTALSSTAQVLMSAKEMRNPSGKDLTENPHAGKFQHVKSRYLGNAKYTGNSQKAWYLLADPREAATVEVVFLNGRETPTIETAEANFNQLGIQMRAYHDFGANLQDPNAGHKMKGEA